MTPPEAPKGRIEFGRLGLLKEKEALQKLQSQLIEILTEGDPYGFHIDLYTKTRWRKRRRKETEEYGEEALINLFPKDGHEQYTYFLNLLARKGEIYTVTQLIEQKNRIGLIRNIGPKRLEAAELIIDFFEGK